MPRSRSAQGENSYFRSGEEDPQWYDELAAVH